MRRISWLSSLSASLVALTVGSVAAASPGFVSKSGQFRVQDGAVSATSAAPTLAQAAKSVLADQVEASRTAAFGKAHIVKLASGDRVVKLPQVHMGLPVAHRGATVTFAGATARHLAARLESELPGDVTPDLSLDQASGIAEGRTGLPVKAGQGALALWPTPDGVRLVWVMSAVTVPGIAYQPVTVVDAKSGEIVYVYNAILDLNQSKVFPSNPLKSPGLVDVTLPVGAGMTVLENDLVRSLNCIDNKSVKTINVGIDIQVHTCDLVQTVTADGAGDYQVAPGENDAPEDGFSEVSMFHHVNRAYDMFRGWDPGLQVNKGEPISTVSNLRIPQGFDTFDLNKLKNPELALVPFQNAFFAPEDPTFAAIFGISGGAMYFGQGPINDYSYDGDVVYHEFTHAVVNATLKLIGPPHLDAFGTVYSPGGMNEGLSDYFSSALTGDGDVGEYASQDFFPGSKAIRSLTNPDSCPTAIGGEVHQDATLFSGSLWDVRVALAPAEQVKLDAAVFAAMNASPTGDLAYEDFAQLVLTQVKASLGDATAQALTAAFTTRGLLPQCTRILEYTGTKLTGPKDLSSVWFAPGTQSTGVKNSAGKWTPGVVQIHSALEADTVGLNVEIRDVPLGGGGFGGGGTAFTPKLLVRFSKDPITFKYKPLTSNDDVMVVDAVKAGSKYTAFIGVPAGATDVHIMIGSSGETDGAYTDFLMTATVEPQTTGSGGSGGNGGGGNDGTGGAGGSGDTGGGGAGGSGGGKDDSVEGGCGCAVPGSNAPASAGFVAIAALGLLAMRRRRGA